jgi:ubiquinone/menaquinone biosynthesis C-methylase UbiE
MPEPEIQLVNIFKDAALHKAVAGVIARHLTSKNDIRDMAFDGIDLSDKHDVLDLGCGFGFFTEGLAGRNHNIAQITGIDRHPEYEWFFFLSCEKVGIHIPKKFISSGSNALRKLETGSFDLVLCSYALYFFPEMIAEISRVMKKDGLLIAITHATPHMHQFSEFVRVLLSRNGLQQEKLNPYEALIGRFSDKNGFTMLSRHFDTICTKNYRAKLVFERDDFEDFAAYFNFKHSFFIPSSMDPDDRWHNVVLGEMKARFSSGKGMEITKDDVIFICSDPVNFS